VPPSGRPVPALDAVRLRALMAIEAGRPEVVVGLLDGPVAPLPALAAARVVRLGTGAAAASGPAARHGTFVAAMLAASRSSAAPGICPGCTLVVRPIFRDGGRPAAAARELADAIADALDAGARLLTVSAALSTRVGREDELERALDRAVRRGAIVVAAAGNDGTVATTPLTRHPGVLAVAAVDASARPARETNLGRSLGMRGVAAPGRAISLDVDGRAVTAAGTSVAAGLVAGACALLWSRAPHASAGALRAAVAGAGRRASILPPLLDAWSAHEHLATRPGGNLP
jgi:subtilisin family serine protease